MKTIFDIDQKKGNSQRNKYDKTIKEKLYWALGNVVMAVQTHKKEAAKYSEFYGVRSCIYHGLMDDKKESRTKTSKNLLEDEKKKMKLPNVCYYCGEDDLMKIGADHMIPIKKGGGNYGENLVPCCSSCNSSKGSKDMLEWMKLKKMNPSILVLRRYLKLALLYCKTNDLVDDLACEYKSLDLPFAFELVPIRLLKPYEMKYFVIDIPFERSSI